MALSDDANNLNVTSTRLLTTRHARLNLLTRNNRITIKKEQNNTLGVRELPYFGSKMAAKHRK